MVLIFSVIILLYIRFIEEKELEIRFGDEYLAYKKRTPFIIPIPTTLWRKK
jgi:protein-S-isoprenylcysteine O-methyltransferase Ste14